MLLRRSLVLCLVGSAISLMGCAAKVTATIKTPASTRVGAHNPKDGVRYVVLFMQPPLGARTAEWLLFRNDWQAAMQSAADANNLLFVFANNRAEVVLEDGFLIDVQVKAFRYVSGFVGSLLGALTGIGFMDVDVNYQDLRTRRELGSKNFNTSTGALQSTISAASPRQIQAVVNQIVSDLANL